MKYFLTAGMLLLTFIAFAQKKLSEISLPTSPAASVLGVQPSATLTPKSFKALEAALYSNFNNGESGLNIPNDFGLEFMPYWFEDHGIPLDDYLREKRIGTQIIRNSSVSIASTQNYMLEDATTTKSLSWGYRTSIFFNSKGYKKQIDEKLKELSDFTDITAAVAGYLAGYTATTQQAYLQQLKQDLLTILTQKGINFSTEEYEKVFKTIYGRVIVLPLNDTTAFNDAVTNIIREEMKVLKTNYEDFKKFLSKKEGFGVDVAYAMLLNFPSNDFEFSVVPTQSVWLAPSYVFNSSSKATTFKSTGVLRYEWYNKDYFTKYFPTTEVYNNNFDYGAAVSMDYNKFSLQFEGTGRSSSSLEEAGTDGEGNILYKKESASDFQYITTISYRVTDQIAFSYQFGKSFKPVLTPDAGTLISLLSLNFGFGGPTTSSMK